MTYARLQATDPGQWRAAALAWRSWAAIIGRWVSDLGGQVVTLRSAWSGTAATAAVDFLGRLRRRLTLVRVLCWAADQALSEFAAALARARALLARAVATAGAAGLVIDDRGRVTAPRRVADPAAPLRVAYRAAADEAAVNATVTQLSAALTAAAAADASASDRLSDLAEPEVPPQPATPLPPSTAAPEEVRRWWDGLTPAQRRWLAVTDPAWLGSRDGLPAAYRDLANRLRLDEQRAELDRAIAGADGPELRRLRDLRAGLDRLEDRLNSDDGTRGYLLRLDLTADGRAAVALGDPDLAANVLTQVPGMTADLESYGRELSRAERIAARAAELDPASATSAVMWLDYDAPDFVDEAAGRSRAEAGAAALRRFQDGLRATHEGEPARLTVLGHSYGSLVVGTAAATAGLEADDVVFAGSPGVGVESAGELHVSPGHVWSTTSWADVIQYTALAPDGLIKDLALARALPLAGPLLAFGLPEDELWHGRNPSDPEFGARVFHSQPDAGHLGYWEPGRPALDALANITLGRGDVIPR
ncbi:MAG TPA: alpha/beta hydrolase [Actinoplanes sp.]|nr:alpha/beta hydrolase [Actinoplanes sp.]